MSNKKQTAVDWLLNDYVNKGVITIEAIEQAKKIEKQQIIDAYHINPLESKWQNIGEQYYKETYE